ncbi:MAG TPA: hypothetical protein PKD49_13350 [Hyphomicrobium sp.]|nr:hypothetical protein [Hyphomicrobium sp.]
MLRPLSICTAAAAGLALTAAAACAQSTTRIETRPFYGATVTIESGVRVFRPLPPERHVIVNPEGKTPLSLGFNETNVYERRVVKNYNYTEGSGSPRDNAAEGNKYYGLPYGYYRGFGYRGGFHDGHGGHGGGNGVPVP